MIDIQALAQDRIAVVFQKGADKCWKEAAYLAHWAMMNLHNVGLEVREVTQMSEEQATIRGQVWPPDNNPIQLMPYDGL